MKLKLACCAAMLALGGCATYEQLPLVSASTAVAYEARSLDNPTLHDFVQRNLPIHPGAWPPPEWNLELLTLAAFYYHPDLDVARAKWSVVQASVITAGMRPNPSLGVSAQHSSNNSNTLSPWTLGLNLDIPIETAGKRGYRIAQSGQLSEAARLAIASTAWQVISRLRGAWLDLQTARNSGNALRQQQRLQQDNVSLLERRFAAGMVSSPEVIQARIALSQSMLAIEDVQRLQIDARTRLAAAVGLTIKALDGVTFVPDRVMPPSAWPSAESRKQALQGRADVLSALSEYAASQSALQLEIANQYPDLHFGPGYIWDQGASKWLLGLSVVLPVMNQNQGPIAEAKSRRIQAMANFNAVQARAIAEIDLALAGRRASVNKLAAVNALLRTQTEQLSKVQASFKAGETDRLVLVGAQLELAQIDLVRVDAEAKAAQALGALEDAIQAPLMAPEQLAHALEDDLRQTKEKNQ